MSDLLKIQLTVNNRLMDVEVPPDQSLMQFLREDLGLTGTKNGCDTGHCGTCTVLLNGKPVRSCVVKMKMPRVAGGVVETIENLSKGEKLHPLQYAFLETDAVQCGFCTPGMIMAAKALIDKNPNPSEQEIRDALKNNLCRCTGYGSIIQAVQLAGEMVASGLQYVDPPSRTTHSGQSIGVSLQRKDSLPKVTGKLKYADDHYESGMLIGKILWSAHPHAKLLGIDTSKAEAMDGVELVLTAKDVPGKNNVGIIIRDQPAIASDKVRYIGDPVAAVFCKTAEIADRAINSIEVEYQPLPPVLTFEEAASTESVPIHENGNLCYEAKLERGDVEQAFREAAVVIEQKYTTPFIEHAFLEPEAGIGRPTEDGGVVVEIGTQCAFDVQKQLAEALGLPLEKVRVVHLPMGGSFGGKVDIVLDFFLALGALRTGKPVKITLTRPESLRVHVKRHAAEMHYKTAADSEGKLLAVQAHSLIDTGAYTSFGFIVLKTMLIFNAGPYYVPNIHLEGKAYFSNNSAAGAMRGFGVPQVTFAMESQMDAMARALGMDPFEFRRKNALDVGLPLSSNHVLEASVGIKETLNEAEDALREISWPKRKGGKIGIGVACGVKNIGFGLGNVESAGAIVELTEAGRFQVRVGLSEIGQGSLTAMAQIAAQELDVPYEWVDIDLTDTALSPPTGPTTASRQTYLSGNAVIGACRKLKKKIVQLASEELNQSPEQLQIKNGYVVHEPSGQELDIRALKTSVLAEDLYTGPETNPLFVEAPLSTSEEESVHRTYWTYSYATQVAVVEVFENTGKVNVLKFIAAHDVGKAINPKVVEGQIRGGVVMGMGYGLSEEFIVEGGWNKTKTLNDCHIPSIMDLPEIVPLIVEEPDPQGPYGAKGVGEIALLPTPAAITNAIFDAVGVRIVSLPATREKVLEAIRNSKESR
jgi:aldehyde oxidoreductase